MTFHVGTSGHSYPEWKGSFYPAKLPAKQMLAFYATRFDTVEVNGTFYRAPTAAVVDGWATQVPETFRFAVKAPQEITHHRRLANVDEAVASLLAVVQTLKKRLGPLLFQLPPNFKKDVPRLTAFLDLLKPRCQAAFEFRHASWFDDEVFALLRKHKAALCIADETDDLTVPFEATADWGYLRLRRTDYDDAALKLWADRMREQAWKDCFVYFKHEDTGTGPKLGAKLLELLAEGSGETK